MGKRPSASDGPGRKVSRKTKRASAPHLKKQSSDGSEKPRGPPKFVRVGADFAGLAQVLTALDNNNMKNKVVFLSERDKLLRRLIKDQLKVEATKPSVRDGSKAVDLYYAAPEMPTATPPKATAGNSDSKPENKTGRRFRELLDFFC